MIRSLDALKVPDLVNNAGENGPVLRNASSVSTNMKVVDSPFIDYVKNKPGILVYRATEGNIRS
nr:N-acetylmuramoyl-L-alanine amidase-like domain-containing protein [Aeromonas salmonicida]